MCHENHPLLFSPETGNLVNFSGYLLNTTVIYLVVLYILSLTGVNKTLSVWQKVVCALPYLFLTTIFILPWTRHWIFLYDSGWPVPSWLIGLVC